MLEPVQNEWGPFYRKHTDRRELALPFSARSWVLYLKNRRGLLERRETPPQIS